MNSHLYSQVLLCVILLPCLAPAFAAEKSVLVAIIDTGADLNHQMLAESIWRNPGETGTDSTGRDKANNGIDDDHNGYVDDIHGWNFADHNNQLLDTHGHGTHIAGIIAHESPPAQLMILKYYDPKNDSSDNLRANIQAIDYAVNMGAKIINFSGGGPGASRAEQNAIARALAKGVLFISAAGNFGQNSDVHTYYPADYRLENIISVASVDQQQHLLNSSNFGKLSVSLGALGKDVLSTAPGNRSAKMTGTSQATAFVSAAAANVLSMNPLLANHFTLLKEQILLSGDFSPELATKTTSSRVVNAKRAGFMRSRELTALGAPIDSELGKGIETLTSDLMIDDP